MHVWCEFCISTSYQLFTLSFAVLAEKLESDDSKWDGVLCTVYVHWMPSLPCVLSLLKQPLELYWTVSLNFALLCMHVYVLSNGWNGSNFYVDNIFKFLRCDSTRRNYCHLFGQRVCVSSDSSALSDCGLSNCVCEEKETTSNVKGGLQSTSQ